MLSQEENVNVFIEAWKLIVGRLPGSKIEHAGGLATMLGHVPLPFFNFSVVDRPLVDEADLRAVLAEARKRAATCEHGSMLGLCDTWAPAAWEQVIAEEGFARAMDTTWMATEQLLPPRRALPALEFRRAVDVATARDLATINAYAYAMPAELFECLFNLHLWREDSYGYVGYADGRAVTAAATFPVAGTVYVALVATMPDAHGNGYADAVMRHAIAQGQQGMGLSRVTLHATDMGQPVYRAMGFEAGSKVVVLVPSNGSAGH